MIGIGGTIRNIARVHQTRINYPLPLTHNYQMDRSAVEQTMHFLASLPLARRKKLEGLSKERADLILPGGAILLGLLRTVDAPLMRVSGRGLRDGAFYTRVLGQAAESREDVLQHSVRNTLRRFQGTEEHAAHVCNLAHSLFHPLVKSGLAPANAQKILYAAAMLHRIGVQVSYYNYDRHTFYLICSSALHGLTHREIVLAAAAASYKGRGRLRKLCSPYLGICKEDDLDLAARIGVVVRLAEAFDRRHAKRVPEVRLVVGEGRMDIGLPEGLDAEVELAAALAMAPHVKKIFGKTLTVGEFSHGSRSHLT